MHEEGEAVVNKRAPPHPADYLQPASPKAVLILLPPPPKTASYPQINMLAPHPKPAPPKMPAPAQKPAAKYQYKKSTEMASVDLDKQTIKILMATKIELSAMDLIAFSPSFRKKVNDISRTHRTSVDEVVDIEDPSPGGFATVGFMQLHLPVSVRSFTEGRSVKNCLLMCKLFQEGGKESDMPSAVVDLFCFNAEHLVGHSTLAKVAVIVSCKVASKESAVYWNLGDRPTGTKYNMY
ncbi:hypothetical protein HDU81_001396 [Chytriomyces hyalinus]|nr:hypothetical protein HDU81_001396 [Chytriomyces hyalinus]